MTNSDDCAAHVGWGGGGSGRSRRRRVRLSRSNRRTGIMQPPCEVAKKARWATLDRAIHQAVTRRLLRSPFPEPKLRCGGRWPRGLAVPRTRPEEDRTSARAGRGWGPKLADRFAPRAVSEAAAGSNTRGSFISRRCGADARRLGGVIRERILGRMGCTVLLGSNAGRPDRAKSLLSAT